MIAGNDAGLNTVDDIRSALDVAWTMTPVDRQNRGRTISARDIRSRGAYTNFEWVETGVPGPAPVAPDRNGIRQGEFRPFLLLPLSPVPFYLSLSGEPPRRPLNVNDRSPNDEVPPMHNAPSPSLPPSSAIETSTPTRNL